MEGGVRPIMEFSIILFCFFKWRFPLSNMINFDDLKFCRKYRSIANMALLLDWSQDWQYLTTAWFIGPCNTYKWEAARRLSQKIILPCSEDFLQDIFEPSNYFSFSLLQPFIMNIGYISCVCSICTYTCISIKGISNIWQMQDAW